MRWFSIRKANIDPALRETFERYGVVGMQVTMGTHHQFFHQGQYRAAHDKPFLDDLLHWLTEQFDRAERKETWLITMETAIVVLVGIEVLSLFGLISSCVPR